MSYTTLDIDMEGQVAWLTLNRPDALNAMNRPLVDELARLLLGGLPQKPEIRVVVLRGAGRAFCAGLDLKETAGPSGSQFERAGRALGGPAAGLRMRSDTSASLPLLMRRAPQPVIACIHGAACGGGFALALASDVRLAGKSARMNAAFIKIGLSACDVGVSYFLPRLVGASLASELLLTGRFNPCREGASARAGIQDRAGRSAGDSRRARSPMRCWQLSPLGLRLTKECLNASLDAGSLEQVIAMEDRNQILCARRRRTCSKAWPPSCPSGPPKYTDQ